jgi:hypothetical protein
MRKRYGSIKHGMFYLRLVVKERAQPCSPVHIYGDEADNRTDKPQSEQNHEDADALQSGYVGVVL